MMNNIKNTRFSLQLMDKEKLRLREASETFGISMNLLARSLLSSGLDALDSKKSFVINFCRADKEEVRNRG